MIAKALRSRLFASGEVLDVTQVTPRMRRVRIAGESLAGLSWTPGQHVRVLVDGFLTLRTYSVWNHDPSWESLELIAYDHGSDAPGNTWMRNVRPGVEVSFTRPEGRLVVRQDAPYHLFAGDETASVAFGPMLRALPAGAGVYGAVAAVHPEDHLDLDPELVRVVPSALLETVGSLGLPDEPGVAYLAGEARTVQAIRAHLVNQRGWPRRNVLTKPFWAPGKRGLD
ncbi:siderophore-interacting protein [Nonomuraea sp. NPDC050556]|uniref:siderophore-interacting protein n=1 Tax=Nonomuraea sp. NPDC050556 TaxID=3364369 RepID=UPI00378DE6A2